MSVYLGGYTEARLQLMDAIDAWDFSPLFPSGWPTDRKGPLTTEQWPYELIDQMLQETDGQMTQPIISFVLAHSTDTFRALGDHMTPTAAQPPLAPGMQRKGTRLAIVFSVSCWADEKLGGLETCEKLAGYVQACCFYNRRRLPAYRHLRCHNNEGAYQDRAEIWVQDLFVEGDAVVSYDEPIP